MSDILEEKIDNVASDVKAIRADIGTLEDTYDSLSGAVQRVSRWALDGNGESAEHRLKNVERNMDEIRKCVDRVSSDEGIERIAAAAVKGVIGNAKMRDKTLVAKLGTIGPIFLGVAAIVSAVAALLK